MNIIKICFIGIILTLSATAASEIDPLKNINERTHVLNQTLDLQLASPIARFYKRVTPDFIEISITNFTSNIEDLSIAINNILQGKLTDGISDITRFTINSTLGIGGFIDVASKIGLERHEEDFGQTLAVWGVGEGPYIMLPGLGPSTLRDTFSRPVSSFLSVTFHMTETDVNIALKSIDAIETRERLLEVESLLSGDKYSFVKDAYIQSIQYEVKDGINVQDDFVDDMDDFLID